MRSSQNKCKVEKSIIIFLWIVISLLSCIFWFFVIAWMQSVIGHPSMLNKLKEINAPYVIVKYEK